jgi:hypothetical protein
MANARADLDRSQIVFFLVGHVDLRCFELFGARRELHDASTAEDDYFDVAEVIKPNPLEKRANRKNVRRQSVLAASHRFETEI